MKLDAEAIKLLKENLRRATDERDRLARDLSELERQITALKTLTENGISADEPVRGSNIRSDALFGARSSFVDARSTAQAVRMALEEFGKPASPKELCVFMLSHGFVWTKKKPFSLFIGPELFRQAAKKGSPVRRIGSGIYQYSE